MNNKKCNMHVVLDKWVLHMLQKPAGQTPECKDSKVPKVSRSSKLQSNNWQFENSSSRNRVNMSKYPMENQTIQIQHFHIIQCQRNRMMVCILSFSSSATINLASNASLKNICKSWGRFCLVIMWHASCRSYVQFCDMA